MKEKQLKIDFECAVVKAHLKQFTNNDLLFQKLEMIDEVELRKIELILNRIQLKKGSIHHFIKYLQIILK